MLQPRCTRLAWMVVALLLAARALVPMGWMPSPRADGIQIELCTGHGAITATIDGQGRIIKGAGESDQQSEACPYAVISAPADTPALASMAEPLLPVALARPQLAGLAIAPYPHGPRPPTRGPPAIA